MAEPLTVWLHSRYESEELEAEPGLELRYLSDEEREELTPADLQGVDGYVGFRPELPAEAFEEVGSDLAFLMRPSAGFDNIDLEAATERGILVVHAPQGTRDAVVEGVIGIMVSCARGLHAYNATIREQGFEGRWDQPAFELSGATVGILGLGQIGRRVASFLGTFDPEIKAHDPYADEEWATEAGVDLVSLNELLETSDLVTIHVPLTEETHHMLGREEFRRMNESGFLINAARGGVYPDGDLAWAIREGEIAGAAVDVFEDEPDIGDNPLLDLDQEDALLTPHILGVTDDARKRIHDLVTESVLSVARGEFPPNILNPEVYADPVPEDRISEAYVE